MLQKLDNAQLTNGEIYLLRFLERGGSLTRAKELFARAVVKASVRRLGSCKGAALQLGVHRNTITRYAKTRRVEAT